MLRFSIFALFSLMLAACAERPHLAFEDRLLRVRIVSDYVPFHEAMRADVDIYQGGVATASPLVEHFDRALAIDAPLADGVVVAFVRGVVPGTYTLRGALRRADGSVLGTAELVVESQGTELYTLYITSGCAGIECEAGTTCLQGECVDSRCTPLAPAFCPPDLLCEADSECTSAGICSMADCMEGICLDVSNVPSTCDEGEWCAREDGCVPNTGEPVEPTGCESDPRLNRVCAVPGRACWYGYWTCVDEAVICAPFHTYPVGASCGTNMYCDSAGECGEGTPCPAGYTGTIEAGCEDINECDVGIVNGVPSACDPFTTIGCRNTEGSFVCVESASLNLTIDQTKQFHFTWNEVLSTAATYSLLLDEDGASGYVTVASGLTSPEYTFTEPLHFRPDARYALQVCIGAVCETVDDESVAGTLAEAVGYFKAMDYSTSDGVPYNFGSAVALSGDGLVLAVGAYGEDSDLEGVHPYSGTTGNSMTQNSGAVYVFRRRDTAWEGSEWVPEAYIKAHPVDPYAASTVDAEIEIRSGGVSIGANFGTSLALSYDGSKLVVGAPHEPTEFWARPSGGAWTMVPSPFETGAGSVYTYNYDAIDGWEASPGEHVSQLPQLLAAFAGGPSDETSYDAALGFGTSLALSADGRTLAVGGTSGVLAGSTIPATYVHVYGTLSGAWAHQSRLTGVLDDPAVDMFDRFGSTLALSADGSRLIVGAPGDDSASVVLTNGASAPVDNSTTHEDSGAAYVFARTPGGPLSPSLWVWTQELFIKAPNAEAQDSFGYLVAMSHDGMRVVASAPGEASASTVVSTTPATDNVRPNSGALYVFNDNGTNWAFGAYLKTSISDERLGLGSTSLAISGDGSTIASSVFDERRFTGVNGTPSGTQGKGGAVFVFRVDGGVWSQRAHVKPSNVTGITGYGHGVCLSFDGETMSAATRNERSRATGVNGSQTDVSSSFGEGAVYLY